MRQEVGRIAGGEEVVIRWVIERTSLEWVRIRVRSDKAGTLDSGRIEASVSR